MKKIVYITGCLGFIGSHVTQACLDRGWYVKGVDKITYAANEKLLDSYNTYPNFSFVHCDINDLKFLYECDYIINTAAETHVGNSIVSSTEFVKSNIDGVHNLLNLIKNYRAENTKKPTLIHFSTDEVYGDIVTCEHLETDMLKPSNPYAATKAAADMLILAWCRTHGIGYNIIRPTNNYGIGQYVEKLIPKAIKYLHLGKPIPLHNNGLSYRNWLHAADTATAVITIIENGELNQIYNVSGNFEQQNIETIKQIISKYYSDTLITDVSNYIDFSYSRPGEDVRYSLNDTKLKNIGWVPKREFNVELENIVNYYKQTFIW